MGDVYRKNRSDSGSVALITVIVITGLLLATGIAAVLTSADLAVSVRDHQHKMRVGHVVRSCLEEALLRIKDDESFAGNFSFSMVGGSCEVGVGVDPLDPDLRTIDIVSTADGFEKSRQYTVNISLNPYQLVE
ncbi:MAG: hypothetical protein PHG63_02730 [Candidatus Dojkabacteria bacterium]|nr:hypothetical protein [Candidatus Dojkabacteria bacterium]